MPRPEPSNRDDFVHFASLPTRWMDNDLYGHVNNVVYYSYFDTAVNRFLIESGVLDIRGGSVIGLVVETGCSFFEPLSFPEVMDIGLAVENLGTSSVRYRIGIFREGRRSAAAQGHFVHVYVDRATRRPTPLSPETRAVLESLRPTSQPSEHSPNPGR